MQNIHGIFTGYQDKKKGEAVQLVVMRNGEQINIESSMMQKEDNHLFKVNPNASKEQIMLREKWMKQLN